MKTRPQYKRRNYFINKEFQGRYIFNYFVLTVLGSLLFVGVFSFFSSNTLSIVFDNYHLQIGMTPGILFKKILSTQWLFIVLGGGIVILVTLFFTHRVAGPFFRFEQTIDDMLDGELSRKIILRKKDEGKDLAIKINIFNCRLGDNLATMETLNDTVAVSTLHLKKVLEESNATEEDFMPFLNGILESQKNIQTLINGYTFSREKF